MIYYFDTIENDEIVEHTYDDFDKCYEAAKRLNVAKFRDNMAGEYFVTFD